MPNATVTIGDTVRYDQHVAGPIYYTVLGFRPTDLGFLVLRVPRRYRGRPEARVPVASPRGRDSLDRR